MKSRKHRIHKRKTFRKFKKSGKKNKTRVKRHMMIKKSKKSGDSSKLRQVGGNPNELIDAIRKNNTALIPGLIEKGADVNARNNDGDTPLIWATVWATDNNNTDIVRLLIEKGADVKASNNNGDTPLLLATKDSEIFKMIEDKIERDEN